MYRHIAYKDAAARLWDARVEMGRVYAGVHDHKLEELLLAVREALDEARQHVFDEGGGRGYHD